MRQSEALRIIEICKSSRLAQRSKMIQLLEEYRGNNMIICIIRYLLEDCRPVDFNDKFEIFHKIALDKSIHTNIYKTNPSEIIEMINEQFRKSVIIRKYEKGIITEQEMNLFLNLDLPT